MIDGIDMNFGKWLQNWGMDRLKISPMFLEMEWKLHDADKAAAWELYIELLTRIANQPLPQDHGDEKAALDSVYSLFPTTRDIIKNNGPKCIKFTQIAVVILNQRIRPFTAKWHRLSINGAFSDDVQCRIFREELLNLQTELRIYTKMLADMAGVEDLTELESE